MTDPDGRGPHDGSSPSERDPDRRSDVPPWGALAGSDADSWDGDDRRGRTRRLLVLAAIPWLVVAVLGARTLSAQSGSSAEPATAAPSPAPASPSGAGASPAAPDHDPAPRRGPSDGDAPVPAAALRFGPRVAPGPSDAAAAALLVARSWLGGVGPRPAIEVGSIDGPPVYVEHLAVEAVDLPTSDTAVVTVLAVVLDVEDGAYTDARVVRLAVPITLTAGAARPADEPWVLPAPDLAVDGLEWTPVDDAEALAAAGAALAAAGYRDVSVHDLARSASWPLRATVTAVAPTDDQAREHTIWLREHLGDLVVAGTLPDEQEDHP